MEQKTRERKRKKGKKTQSCKMDSWDPFATEDSEADEGGVKVEDGGLIVEDGAGGNDALLDLFNFDQEPKEVHDDFTTLSHAAPSEVVQEHQQSAPDVHPSRGAENKDDFSSLMRELGINEDSPVPSPRAFQLLSEMDEINSPLTKQQPQTPFQSYVDEQEYTEKDEGKDLHEQEALRLEQEAMLLEAQAERFELQAKELDAESNRLEELAASLEAQADCLDKEAEELESRRDAMLENETRTTELQEEQDSGASDHEKETVKLEKEASRVELEVALEQETVKLEKEANREELEVAQVEKSETPQLEERERHGVVNLHFTVGSKAVAIRVETGRRDRDPVADLEVALESLRVPNSVSSKVKDELVTRLGSSCYYDQKLWDHLRKRRSGTESISARWEQFLNEAKRETDAAKELRLVRLPIWFRKDLDHSKKNLVFRQAVGTVLGNEEMLRRVCAHEKVCSEALQQAVQENERAKQKLQEVQLHEMQFMCESLAAGHGVTEDDVRKLSLSHVHAMEQLDRSHASTVHKILDKGIAEHRSLVLSLAGQKASAPSKSPVEEVEMQEQERSRGSIAHTQADIGTMELLETSLSDLRDKGLSALVPSTMDDDDRSLINKKQREQRSELASPASPVGHFMVGQWVSNLVASPLSSLALELEDGVHDVEASARRILSPLSTSLQVVETYLGAQLKVLFCLRVETLIGGVFAGLTCKTPSRVAENHNSNEKDQSKVHHQFEEWRRECLEHLYSPLFDKTSRTELEKNGFRAIAMPCPQSPASKLNERLVNASSHIADLHFTPWAEQGELDQAVVETWHSNFAMGVVCSLHAQTRKREDGVRAILEHAASIGVGHLILPLREWVLESSALEVETKAMKSGSFQRTRLNPKAVTKMFRAVKASLSNLAHRNECKKLHSITFLLKSSCSSNEDAANVLSLVGSTHQQHQQSQKLATQVLNADSTITKKARDLMEKIFEN